MAETLADFALGKKIVQEGSLQKVGVVGAGTTGQQIIRLVSKAGIDVVFVDVSEERVQQIFDALDKQLDEKINRWGLTAGEKRAMLSRIQGSSDFSILKGSNIVIETIHSKKKGTSLDLRRDVFKKIEAVVDEKTTIVSNTATLNISEISEVLDIPERAMGLHFILPVDQVKIVEAVRTIKTDDRSYDCITKFIRMVGKEMVEVQESPGNISTRMIVPLINEACSILLEGVASVPDIDKTIKHTTGYQTGPFELADNMGLDKVLKWMDNLYSEFGEIRYKPSPIIKRLVRAGMVGRLSGEGFYSYPNGKRTPKKGDIQHLGRIS
ncbi:MULTISPECIES: 3-hydroxyacyl-CoA dehydrogenase family protein [unclassified Lentimicrobium]|uniref:3-hydroxyacyl-CoA dehydrogenase family protein n=1 Tax=unclassified Lentimicrobium TaxID=2677434 RepID=UPI0015532947|nr:MULTISPECIES: 3-hydroxyacyl-CoA dehydrogenase NAD-binding domain-containing protein [unclassified Lentimicrobium]NPD44076.1 3-hydroxyacyl-CoA dehydrogenase family protein [Lentimicrobium sp. S6]NPD86741.1 3-hydroxyacyl-CoA dehydrogenase family protein [Lentimicrobium sp. L6]